RLQPIFVVSIREIRLVVSAAALVPLERPEDDDVCELEHVLELKDEESLLVVDVPFGVDSDTLPILLELLTETQGSFELVVSTHHRRSCGHRRSEILVEPIGVLRAFHL